MSNPDAIVHGVQIESGAFVNTLVPKEIADVMYPSWASDQSEVYISEEIVLGGMKARGINSTLGFTEVDDGVSVAITRNTVERLCQVRIGASDAKNCGNCALAGSGLSISEMSKINCARANTTKAFEAATIEPKSRFMLIATGSSTFVVNDETPIDQIMNGSELMYNKLPAAPSVVMTKSWAERNGLSEIMVGINGADGSFGIATMNILGETVIVPFCSMRDNMGDRGEDKQIIRKAINSYLDTLDLSTDQRADAIKDLNVSIVIGASAALENFAHKIQIPREDEDAPQKEKDNAAHIRANYPELIKLAGGRITSAIVLESEYPGAFRRGSIFPQFEAEMGIHISPITPTNCPGDGQTCHIDYRTETKYALVKQLEAMGVPADQISYDDTIALDPSAPGNNMASNRRDQNNGIAVDMTHRTVNAMTLHIA